MKHMMFSLSFRRQYCPDMVTLQVWSEFWVFKKNMSPFLLSLINVVRGDRWHCWFDSFDFLMFLQCIFMLLFTMAYISFWDFNISHQTKTRKMLRVERSVNFPWDKCGYHNCIWWCCWRKTLISAFCPLFTFIWHVDAHQGTNISV